MNQSRCGPARPEPTEADGFRQPGRLSCDPVADRRRAAAPCGQRRV